MRPLDLYFSTKEEPIRGCMEFMRSHILRLDPDIREAWKYGMPFFCYRGKMFCYLWVHKKYKVPYLGIVEGNKIHHPDLLQEKRVRIKILLLRPDKDLPIKKIDAILTMALRLSSKEK